jgi:hypothetical protein
MGDGAVAAADETGSMTDRVGTGEFICCADTIGTPTPGLARADRAVVLIGGSGSGPFPFVITWAEATPPSPRPTTVINEAERQNRKLFFLAGIRPDISSSDFFGMLITSPTCPAPLSAGNGGGVISTIGKTGHSCEVFDAIHEKNFKSDEDSDGDPEMVRKIGNAQTEIGTTWNTLPLKGCPVAILGLRLEGLSSFSPGRSEPLASAAWESSETSSGGERHLCQAAVAQ